MSNLALAALAGFAATEATGITNVTGSGGGGGRDSPPISIPTPEGPSLAEVSQLIEAQTSDGPDTGAIAQAIASASQSAPTVIETGRGGGDGGTTAAFQSMIQQLQNQNRDLVEEIQEQRQNAEDSVETTRDTAELIRQLRKWREEIPTPGGADDRDPNPGGSDGSDGSSDGSRYTIQQDYNGIFKEEIRGGAEILNQTGPVVDSVTDAPTDAVNFAGKSGRTIGEAWDLVTKGRADTSDTFAKDRGEVMFDFSGDGSPGGKWTDRIPDVDLSRGSDETDAGDDSSGTSTASASSASSRQQTDPIEEYKQTIRDEDDDPDHTAGKTRSGTGGSRLLARVR